MDHKRKAENLGFSKEMTMISEMSSFFDMGMSSDIQGYSTFDDDLEMLIQNSTNNNRDVVDDHSIDIPLESRSRQQEYSEVVNTPNSCSISSSSTEAAPGNDDRKKPEEDDDCYDEGEDQENTKKQLSKPKKKKQKKEREARFAFMTKSDVDHLDDGYRWRKYGQKAVKNSPFPRSYYRCTSTLCGVKKRVERSNEDPSTVVTTYEGMHTHPCPIMPRGSFGILPEISAFGGGSSFVHSTTSSTARQMLPYNQHPYFHQNLTPPRLSFNDKDTFSPPVVQRERPFRPSSSTASARDHGLLQDMLPSKMLKETNEGE